MPFLDTTRFDRLPEAEVLRRIGALLATAIARSGRLRPRSEPARAVGGGAPPLPVDPLRLIADPLERQIVEYLRHAGPASPGELCRALGLRSRSLARKLARLRSGGLCEVVGKTQAARYSLRSDFGRN